MTTILLAIDESTYSQAAADELMAAIRPADVMVHVLHVLELDRMVPVAYDFARGAEYGGDVAAHLRTSREAAEHLVGSVCDRLQAAGFATTAVIREGDPRHTILDYATECGCRTLVIGSHGRRGVDRFFMGSVSDAVARHAHCSVYIVRAKPLPAPPPA